jgi:hypothetical protein
MFNHFIGAERSDTARHLSAARHLEDGVALVAVMRKARIPLMSDLDSVRRDSIPICVFGEPGALRARCDGRPAWWERGRRCFPTSPRYVGSSQNPSTAGTLCARTRPYLPSLGGRPPARSAASGSCRVAPPDTHGSGQARRRWRCRCAGICSCCCCASRRIRFGSERRQATPDEVGGEADQEHTYANVFEQVWGRKEAVVGVTQRPPGPSTQSSKVGRVPAEPGMMISLLPTLSFRPGRGCIDRLVDCCLATRPPSVARGICGPASSRSGVDLPVRACSAAKTNGGRGV